MRQLKITKSITRHEARSLRKYFYEISQIPRLTPEEEVILAQKIKQGDQKSIDKLARSNLLFVVSVAKKYQNQGLSLPDLINEGNLGLMRATKKFDEKRGFKFTSYAVWWIRQAILEALGETSRMIRLPKNKIRSVNDMKKASSVFEQQNEREPSPEELADIMGISKTDVYDIMKNDRRPLSSDNPIIAGSETTFIDVVTTDEENPEDFLSQEDFEMSIKRLLNSLEERDAKVITHFFGLNGNEAMLLEDIAGRRILVSEEGKTLSRERIRQFKEKAILEIQRPIVKNLLRAYL